MKNHYLSICIAVVYIFLYSCQTSENKSVEMPKGEKFKIYKDSVEIAQKEGNYNVF